MPLRPRVEHLETVHGHVVVLELTEHEVAAALEALPVDERSLAASLSELRRRELVAGRTAMHIALAQTAAADTGHPVLRDDRGAPVLPSGWVGSLSHKHSVA